MEISPEIMRAKLLSWLRTPKIKWCRGSLKNCTGACCALGFVCQKLGHEQPYATADPYGIAKKALGFAYHSDIVKCNDDALNPAEAADKLEALFAENPVEQSSI